MNKKICKDCKIEKDISEFASNYNKECNGRYGSDCLSSICKDCNSIRNKEWRDENKEHDAERKRKWVDENPNRDSYNHKKNNAKYRNKSFNLTLEWYLDNVWDKQYFYCGEASNGGMDRVDNNIGYETDNIVPCCKWCNSIKMEHTIEDMEQHLRKILERIC